MLKYEQDCYYNGRGDARPLKTSSEFFIHIVDRKQSVNIYGFWVYFWLPNFSLRFYFKWYVEDGTKLELGRLLTVEERTWTKYKVHLSYHRYCVRCLRYHYVYIRGFIQDMGGGGLGKNENILVEQNISVLTKYSHHKVKR